MDNFEHIEKDFVMLHQDKLKEKSKYNTSLRRFWSLWCHFSQNCDANNLIRQNHIQYLKKKITKNDYVCSNNDSKL